MMDKTQWEYRAGSAGSFRKTFKYSFIVLVLASLLAGCARATPAPGPANVPQPQGLLGSEARVGAARGFLDLLIQQDYTAAFESFDPKMKEALPVDKLEATWEGLLSQVGPFKQVVSAASEAAPPYERIVLTSEFEKATLDVRVVFDEAGQIAGLFFAPSQAQASTWTPPEYVQTDRFDEVEVVVGSGEWALPGSLSIPAGEGPFPAVALVHGSGPNDRDESVGPNKTFRDLAWGLASQGIAVLRYEKRTKEHAERLAGIAEQITVQEETIDDALEAVTVLRKTEKIDPGRIYVLGHSLGGMLVPRIGVGDQDVAGFIIMAGLARPMEDTILEQITYISSLEGTPAADAQEDLEKLRLQVEQVKDPSLSTTTPPSELPLGVPAAYWLDLRGYQPAEMAKELDRPMLILQGGRDYQVTQADFELWKQALGSEEEVEFKLYPALNHLFITGEGKIMPAEYMNPGHVAEEVIQDIAGWIQKN